MSFRLEVLLMLTLSSVLTKIHYIIFSAKTLEEACSAEIFLLVIGKCLFLTSLCLSLGGFVPALNRFFKKYRAARNTMSQQALSKARSHFDHSPFEKMFRATVEMRYCGDHKIATLHGCQLLAVTRKSPQHSRRLVMATTFTHHTLT